MKQESLELEEILQSIRMLSKADEQAEAPETPNEAELYSRERLEQMGFVEPQIDEINLGIQQQLPVSRYARACYNWKQMQEIRMGLLENLDISWYDNQFFSAEQMREIRMGLMDHLDVSSYANLIYSTKDMKAMRKSLLSDAYQVNPTGYAEELTDADSGIKIRISDDCMHAFLKIPKGGAYTMWELERILNRHHVIHGISKTQLKKLLELSDGTEEVEIASGTPAVRGDDGRYEYFFNPLLPDEPVEQDDGSVDYTQVIVADKRNAGDILAKYYPAKEGTDGETVTGILIKGQSGRQLPILQGQGVTRDAARNIYTARCSGYVLLNEQEGTLNVWDIYEVNGDVNRYNGHISYNGIIHIRGSVCDMAEIEATGNVVVDGYVEAAHIKAGGNIILRGGMNGCGSGVLEADGKVVGKFFEAAAICARGNVEGNYFLNCNVTTDGSVLAKGTKSRIMGGSIKAGYSVEAYSIMDTGKTVTLIDVGDPWWFAERKKQVCEQMEKVQDELHQLREGKNKIGHMFGDEATEENALFHKVCMAIRIKEEEKRNLKVEKDYQERAARRAEKAYIKIYSLVQAGVKFSIRGQIRKMETDISKAIVFES